MSFLHGFLLAFGLILPLGVQNVFIFNQGATQPRFTQTLPAVITAALADTLLILLAVLGVSVVVLSVTWLKMVLIWGGIVFLLYMGLLTWKSAGSQPVSPEVAATESPPATSGTMITAKKQVVFAASVSLLNPHAILDTIGVIGTSSLQYTGVDKVWFTAATILVSWVWFVALASAGRIVGRLSPAFIPFLSRISAGIMWLSAGYLVLGMVSGKL